MTVSNSHLLEEIILHFNLKPHPEGGFFHETYRSQDIISSESLSPLFSGPRSFSTAIYYLLPQSTRSAFHRILSDEVWHFYLGDPMILYELDEETQSMTKTILGQNFKNGEKLQHVVPAGRWFGGHPLPQSSFSFVGCTVAPGFDFRDFQLATREDLFKKFLPASSSSKETYGERAGNKKEENVNEVNEKEKEDLQSIIWKLT